MLPRLSQFSATQSLYLKFIDTLKQQGFAGDLNPDYANRVVQATDNSLYQVLPQGVVYPKNLDDLVLIAKLSDQEAFHPVVLSPRGGGTGTNGQSLTDGLVVDISKHMNQVLEINADERWVRVQTGVVKDQLNAALKPYGLFFAPELSTSNRATIGGMINTDASGQGSVLYGKTRDHVLELTTVLLDGSVLHSHDITEEELDSLAQKNSRSGNIHRITRDIFDQHQAAINDKFPPLNRCLTGYDLAHIRNEKQQFNLNNILCGSEGTLGFIAEAKLNVLPIPKCSALVNVQYGDFESSLRDAQALMSCEPTSIETVDSKVLSLAKGDIIWHSVSQYFPESTEQPVAGINLVEYTADSEDELKAKVAIIEQRLKGDAGPAMGYTIAWSSAEVNKIWAMRKKAVGLLGNAKGEARPVPFVEDTAVPPEHLADFIMEFRAILDQHNLTYGMFGHVDAGVLHVRPALDLKDPEQIKLVRRITDEVVAKIQKYNGLLWGEHGKGVRSEYAPEFFGDLYPLIQQIKGAFDPRNQLNPGKIATPNQQDAQLLKIDEVVTRGELDRTIHKDSWEQYSEGMFCNGNGACFNFDPNDAMCPSWKATRERKNSPKGRASLIREWLRMLSDRGVDTVTESGIARRVNGLVSALPRTFNTLGKKAGQYDFNHEIHDSMSLCLACKSCTGSCPIKVDVPEFRAKFLELYYSRYLRPLKDYFIGTLEFLIPWLAKWPLPYNLAMQLPPVKWFLKHGAGMVDSPLIAVDSLAKGMKYAGIPWATEKTLGQLSSDEKAKAVILVQDAFTSFFDPKVVLETLACLQELGFKPMVMPFTPNGKPLHVHGFLPWFKKTATRTTQKLQQLAQHGVPLIGMDPSLTLTFRAEYEKYVDGDIPKVHLIQEWLATQLDQLPKLNQQQAFYLLGHCTEKTNAAPAMKDWQSVFSTLGLTLEEIKVGCCGMAGTFGHETPNQQHSRNIYDLSWAEPVNNTAYDGQLMTTGYSCRSQVKRYEGKQILHPMQQVLRAIRQANSQ